jgi:hypothetical protein
MGIPHRYGIVFSASIILLLLVARPGVAGEDDRIEPVSTIMLKDTAKQHDPKLAGALSAVIPGLGQAYNKKYWKVPLIYAGAGALLYAINYNAAQYDTYKDAYSLRIDGDTSTVDQFDIQVANDEPKYTEESLLNLKDYYRRNRDISYIFIGVLYMLNIVDAAVDAHFYSYEISDDLSLKVRPAIIMSAGRTQTTGIALTLSL